MPMITVIYSTLRKADAFNFPTPFSRTITTKHLPSLIRESHPRDVQLSKLCSTSDDSFFDGYDEFIGNLKRKSEIDNVPQYNDDSQPYEGGRDSRRGGNNNRGSQRQEFDPFEGSGKRRKGYIRDPNDDMSVTVDEVAINDQIKARSQAQFERDYDLADKIRDDLNEVYGVYVWDKDSLWTTSSIAPRRRFQGSDGQEFGPRVPREFGRYGHDYIQIGAGINPDECPLALDEIHALLAKRLEFKLSKKYNEADEIQVSLYENGVRVHDKLKQWRADGNLFSDLEGIISGKKYTISEFSDAVDVSLSADIQRMVDLREDFRSDKDYNTADEMRDELWETYSVAVDDKSRSWSAGGDFGPDGTFRWTDDGPINPRRGVDPTLTKDWRKLGTYTQSTSSEELNDPDAKEEVANLVHDRLEARRVKDYSVADEIKDHLYDAYNISVDDKLRQWSVGGDFGSDSMKVRETSPTAPDGKKQSSFVRVYNHRGGNGDLSDTDVALVEALVQRFSEERARYNKQAAISICIGLKKKYSVVIDDINGEWHVQGDDYVLSNRFEGKLSTDIENARGEIEEMIRERSQAKEKKDIERADEIRSDLMAMYGIEVDDRLKEWTVLENVGDVPSDTIVEDGSNAQVGIDNIESNSVQIQNLVEDSLQGQEEEITTDEEVEREGEGGSKIVDDEVALSALTVPLLKEKLRTAGLRVSGRKAELVQRILDSQ